MNMFRLIAGIYFYGSFHIGLGALAMSTMTFYILDKNPLNFTDYLAAVFFGTVSFYALHRIYDLDKIADKSADKKYLIIRSSFRYITVILVLASILATYFYFQLELGVKVLLLLSAIITIWYTIPFGLKKLKEVPHVKIFIIALLWGVITSGIPAYYSEISLGRILLLIVERSTFIFALTLAFDIRDYLIDRKFRLQTIPVWMGKKNSIRLSVLSLVFIQTFILSGMYFSGIFSLRILTLMILTNLITAGFVSYSDKITDDFYFTGLLDGMLIFQPLIVLLLGR